MKLIYHTRGNASPQGKPRIYFTGHPADLPAYSKEIFADILKTQNCAIYYDEEPEAPYHEEDLLRELEQMQLIVIPVTSRFLYQSNRARNIEFSFAMEHHIPVLPLMQEQGLESAFNEKCGDLQMLNKSDPDPTALPYTEKLEKFLASVLVGDELAKKVRAAFDAYVFLSYRKKDRKYAQELMRLIHRNDFCRDIAIWYDEFLTPGENFNQAIADAMNKCQLFTLAVTPNVVEPGNYVMRLEYPEAKKSGKPILPVELVPTDKETLQNSFPNIPPCTDAHNETAFSAALLEAVQKLAIRENDDSPEHNFFIGLAYLNGIDVEVNRERALALITGAAESGLPEAMKKLVSMYRSGDGVKRDYHAAIQWQERLVDSYQARYEEKSTRENGFDWIISLCDLGDYQRECDNLSAAKRTYQHMLTLSRSLFDMYGDAEMRRGLFISYIRLGHIGEGESKLAEAKMYFLQGLELSRLLYEETKTAQAQRDLSISYNSLGRVSNAEGNLTEAKSYFLQGLELSRLLYEETGTIMAQRDLFDSYYNLGHVSEAEGNLTEAKSYFLQSLELSRLLYEETGTIMAQQELSSSYYTLGHVNETEGNLTEAKSYFLQSLELRRLSYEETGTVSAQRELSISYNSLGYVSEAEKNPAMAKTYFLQGLELNRLLYEETGTIKAQVLLSASYNNLGRVNLDEGNLTEAKSYFLQGLELDKLLDEETGILDVRERLSLIYGILANISMAENAITDAKDYFLKLIELYQQADETKIQWDYAASHYSLGDISKMEGNMPAAKDYYLKSLALFQKLYKETGAAAEQRAISVCYNNLGEICQAEGDFSRAKEYFMRDLELSRQLYKETGTAIARQDLYDSYNTLGDLCRAEGNRAEAEYYYQHAKELGE